MEREAGAAPAVEGRWREDLAPLVEVFRANFVRRGEVGASLCVMQEGETLVDVWAGAADPESGRPWRADTVGVVFSNSKPATALCLHLLAERGFVSLDDPVARYWPEYAAEGKDGTTLRMLLDHSAGLPALRAPLPDGAAFDWQEMTARLAIEAPFWEPGTRCGYHGLTFGWLVGEVVRRISGLSLGTFFRQEVAGPLGLDFWIGLPEREEPRVAPVIPHRPAHGEAPRGRFERAVAEQPESLSALYFRNTGGWRPSGFNSRRGRAAEIPAANGISNARGLAGLYAALACGGRAGVPRLLKPGTVAEITQVSSATHDDATLRVPTRFAAGFMRSMDNRGRGLDSVVLAPGAFGHVGAGGSLGFADPGRGLSFGYTMNRMGPGVLLNPRGQSLVDCLDRLLPPGTRSD
ncbi:CubicO group peptidase, beta-lactamase class C family [Tistlia consotensis]|uniref:CubicO group peptidase, beta-lactamase class C family n=1 Tax=Tistlia consotensis USBA 355 TaxID=560819 RepID=A0A1Y6B930_9PROT|nr:serine hydrolase domain-containing protein [Tistlia consotensis]SME91086.1 CubicO group peptidase, beta-lactamase class C family [Tistlia consotensis USBA 355]SNR27100.1 CubicO group peptidase, beta-lactamase class C family [Tistlia consotensis]